MYSVTITYPVEIVVFASFGLAFILSILMTSSIKHYIEREGTLLIMHLLGTLITIALIVIMITALSGAEKIS